MGADLPEWSGARHSKRMGNSPTSTFASPSHREWRLHRRWRPPPPPRPAGQTLGFADLRSCLQALLDDGWCIPQLAVHLDTTHATVRRAITDHHILQPPRREQFARQRQHAAQQRAAAQVAGLGFGSVRAYLLDRLVTQAWTLTQVTAELGAAPATHTASAGSLPGWAGGADPAATRRCRDRQRTRKQSRAVRQRRQARLAELGFATLDAYLRDRYVERAGRCGGCAPSLGWAMRGSASSSIGSGRTTDL